MIPFKKASPFFIVLSLFITIANSCGSGGGAGNSGAHGGGDSSLSKGVNLSNTATDSHQPVITANSEGNVYLAWEEAVADSKKEIYLGSSGDSGLTFSTKKSLTKESKSSCDRTGSNQGDVSMALGDGNSLFLIWIDSWMPNYSVSEIKSFRENDASCNIVSNTHDTASNAYSPRIALRGSGDIHIIWAEDHGAQRDISYVHSKDNGGTFLPADGPKNLSNSTSDSSEPLLGFDGTLNVNAVWVEGSEGTRKVTFSRSADNGNSFSIPQTISSPPLSDSHCPALASSGAGKIYVAYRGNNSIYFARWESNTSSFSDIGYITPDSISPSCPEMGISSNGVIYVVWSDNGKILVASSTDNGTTFATITDVSDSTGTSSSPKLAIDGFYVNLVWIEEEIGKGDIFFSGSADNGKSFSPPKNLSNSSSPSASPVIASDIEGNIYVAWVEGTEGNREIYYERDKGARGLSPSTK